MTPTKIVRLVLKFSDTQFFDMKQADFGDSYIPSLTTLSLFTTLEKQ
jgi:hypothetical protein